MGDKPFNSEALRPEVCSENGDSVSDGHIPANRPKRCRVFATPLLEGDCVSNEPTHHSMGERKESLNKNPQPGCSFG